MWPSWGPLGLRTGCQGNRGAAREHSWSSRRGRLGPSLQPAVASVVLRRSRKLSSRLHMLSTPGLRYQDCWWKKWRYVALAPGIDTSTECAMQ